MSATDRKDLEDKIQDVRRVLDGDDPDKIKAAHDALQEASWKVSQNAYSPSGAGEGNTRGEDAANNSGGDG